MKRIRKSVAMVVAYLMGVTLLPFGALNTVVSAETVGNYSENYNDNYGGNTDEKPSDSKLPIIVEANEDNGKASVTVNDSISKNDVNTIQVNSSSNVNSVSVKFDSAESLEAFKDGTGSLVISSTISTVKIPFSVIDSSLIDDAKSVSLNVSTSEDKDILDKLKKGVKKVFTFDLVVEKNDGTSVNVHKFANGEAEISFAVTEEDLKDLDVSKLVVLYYNEETKEFEPLETTIENGVVTFKTSHFSSFVLGEKEANTTKDGSKTKTSDGNGILGFTVAALVSLGVVAVSVYGYKSRKLEK
ncbi:MAG: hypothetical protein GX275_10270 [Clostridiales bacterium]|nr:hypothetical protein [Clostridiales bacterium]